MAHAPWSSSAYVTALDCLSGGAFVTDVVSPKWNEPLGMGRGAGGHLQLVAAGLGGLVLFQQGVSWTAEPIGSFTTVGAAAVAPTGDPLMVLYDSAKARLFSIER